MDKFAEIRVPIAHNNPSIRRKENKCVLCGKCKDVCIKQIGVAGNWTYDSEDIVCINCGQCANFCSVEAIVEQDNSNEFLELIQNPNKKVAVIVAPAVRVSLGEEFGLNVGEFVAGKMVSAIKKLGVDFVFDVSFGADLTVMEEACELVERIKSNNDLPQFTSCCPAWVKFVKCFYPQFVPNLSTCLSPIAMLSSVIKNWFAKNKNIKPENLAVVAITPCVAKKMEANLLQLCGEYGKNTDCVITVRELARMLKKQEIGFENLEQACFDEPFNCASNAGVSFGVSGGVAKAVIQTAHYLTTNNQPPKNLIKFKPLAGMNGVKTASVRLLDKELKLCVISGTANARRILNGMNEYNFDFIEVMACPNGCVGGGGQPKQEDNHLAVSKRGESLFKFDSKTKDSYQNLNLTQLYSEFLGEPNGEKAQEFLHMNHSAR